MAMRMASFDDLLRLLDEHPEWRAELRRRVLDDEFLELPALTRSLAAAQQRTEEQLAALTARVDALAVAQQRTEEQLAALTARVDALAVAQQRTEEQLAALTARVDALAVAQQRTEEQLAALTAAQQRTEERLAEVAAAQVDLKTAVERLEYRQMTTQQELGRLANVIGAGVEADTEETLRSAIKAHGWEPLGGAVPLALNGEVDLAILAEEPTGERVWVLAEAKLRLRRRDVETWARMLDDADFRQRLAGQGVTPPIVAYAFGIRVYPDAEEAARATGLGVLNPQGERLAPQRRWT